MANAVLDGCDAILLGAETLRGKQPVQTVETILHICKQAEQVFDHRHHFEHLMTVGFSSVPFICSINSAFDTLCILAFKFNLHLLSSVDPCMLSRSKRL